MKPRTCVRTVDVPPVCQGVSFRVSTDRFPNVTLSESEGGGCVCIHPSLQESIGAWASGLRPAGLPLSLSAFLANHSRRCGREVSLIPLLNLSPHISQLSTHSSLTSSVSASSAIVCCFDWILFDIKLSRPIFPPPLRGVSLPAHPSHTTVRHTATTPLWVIECMSGDGYQSRRGMSVSVRIRTDHFL